MHKLIKIKLIVIDISILIVSLSLLRVTENFSQRKKNVYLLNFVIGFFFPLFFFPLHFFYIIIRSKSKKRNKYIYLKFGVDHFFFIFTWVSLWYCLKHLLAFFWLVSVFIGMPFLWSKLELSKFLYGISPKRAGTIK